MSVTSRPYTYDDLVNTPDDGQRYEIIGGKIIVSPSPALDHQRGVTRLSVWLAAFAWDRHLGEVFPSLTAVKLTAADVVQPDILFVARQRSDILHEQYVAGAPDLVIEVLSDKTRRRDLGEKKA